MPEAFQAHLLTALDRVRVGVPGVSAALGTALGHRVVRVEVDAEPFALAAVGGAVGVVDARRWDVLGRATPGAIDDLLDGRDTVEAAVLAGRVQLVGGLDDLLALDGALRLFVQGAVRAPGVLDVLASWRARSGADP